MTTTPDLSGIEALNSRSGRNRCTVGELLDGLTGEQRDTLEAALARPSEGAGKIEHAAIDRWLRKQGINGIAPQTIGRHRNGQCGCGR